MNKLSAYCRCLVFLHLSVISINAFSQNEATARGEINLHKTGRAIKIDGILDEPVWKKALFADKFYGKEDSVHFYSNTKTYITYDDDNLYIGFSCSTKDTSLLPHTKFRKDDERIWGNEWVAFCVDTYNDGLDAMIFLNDAVGNQWDGELGIGNSHTFSFSTQWASAVHKNKHGYSVEMKIPLTKLPVQFNGDSVVMAVRVVRMDKELNGEIQSPFLKEDIQNKLAQFQKVVLKGIHQTHPANLTGINLVDRMRDKQERAKLFDINTEQGRSLAWGDASIMDYGIFKKREIHGSAAHANFPYKLDMDKVNAAFEKMEYIKGYPIKNFEIFLERTKTTAFLVLSDDTIIYEKYFNGFNRNSIFTSFSVAKSFVSTLIGLATADGYIKSDTDKIVTYIPELLQKDKRFANIRIKDLLSMSSGLHYSGDEGCPSDDEITYYDPDLWQAALKYPKVEEPPGLHWLYDNYHPLLLGLILERTTHMPVSRYLEERLWKKMGGGNASWSLDEHGFEKMESGINCSPYDYARFGELFLHNGKFNSVQVVPVAWIQKATQPQPKPEGWGPYFQGTNGYYGYFWWGRLRVNKSTGNDFFAQGNKGEYIYVCPKKKLVIIRLGYEFGLPGPDATFWPNLFYEFATDYKNH